LTTAALLLALASEVLHAGWNVLLAGADDVEATTAVTVVIGVAAAAPFAAATWEVEPLGYAYAIPSGALELLYFALLAYAYRTSEVSVVYPMARGVAPVLWSSSQACSSSTRGRPLSRGSASSSSPSVCSSYAAFARRPRGPLRSAS
jgi:multidrug transporter EmrE-like cation transporter